MGFGGFFYRQGQRLRYHVSSNPVTKAIAEINRFHKLISIRSDGYFIDGINLLIPKNQFDFIFKQSVFELLLSLPERLDGKYLVIDGRLYIRFSDLMVEITSESELYILEEIFCNTCYSFVVPHNEKVRVIDAGMNVGIAALFFAGLPYVKAVHAFEPFPKTFKQAENNFKNNVLRAEKIQASNFGLGAKHARLSALDDHLNSGRNTTLMPKVQEREGTREVIQIAPAYDAMTALFTTYPEDKFVLKIDTEGAEYPIFDSLFCQLLSAQVKVIMVEWHFRGPQELEKKLLANDFMYTSIRLNPNSGLIYAFR